MSEQEHAPNANREWTGRFLPGNTASKGQGRLPRAAEQARLDTLRSVVTDEKWRKVCEKALDDALSRNWRCRERGRRFIAEYLIGKPAQTLNIRPAGPENPFSEYEEIPDEELRRIAAAGDREGDSGDAGMAAGGDGAA